MTTAAPVSERRIRVGMVLMGVSRGFLALVGLFPRHRLHGLGDVVVLR